MARTIAKDHDEKRTAILRQAAMFFAENGYDAASMRDLAAVCGISKALIYHYYPSKNALLLDILGTHLRTLLAAMKAVARDATPEENFGVLVDAILAVYRDADAEHKLQFNATARLGPAEQRQLAAIQRQIVAILAERVTALAPHRFAVTPQLVKPTTMAVFGMLNWFYTWHKDDKGISRTDYGRLVTGMVLGGIDMGTQLAADES